MDTKILDRIEKVQSFDKATPRPWRIGDAGYTIFGPPNGEPSPVTIAACKSRDTAALIVAAVNSFDAQRELAAAVVAWYENDGNSAELWSMAKTVIARMRASEAAQ